MDLENTLYLQLKDGRVVIEMHPDIAPKHVARIKELARKNYFDGLKWHRVIEGFMAQGASSDGVGIKGSGQNIPAEFNNRKHRRGSVSMARAQHPDSADSQFFVCLADSFFLDGQYTNWGTVAEGMEFIDNITKGNPQQNGTVTNPDVIVNLRVAADIDVTD